MKKMIWWIVLMTFFTGLRILHITADAPANLSLGRGPFTDEGFYAHNARNKILFGAWSKDEFNYHFISPVMSGLNYVAFRLGGIHYRSNRLVSIIMSLLTVLMLYWWLLRQKGLLAAVIGSVILGAGYFYVMHSRLAISEPTMIAWLMMSWFFLWKEGPWCRSVAGIFLSLAVLTKALALFFGVFALWYLLREKQSGRYREVVKFLAGAILTMAAILVPLAGLHWQEYIQAFKIFVGQRTPAHWSQLFKVFYTEYFAQLPVTSLLSWGSLLYLGTASVQEKWSARWLLLGLAYLALWSYTTPAYFLILLLPMVILTACLLANFRRQSLVWNSPPKWGLGMWAIGGYFLIRYMGIYYGRDFFFSDHWHKYLLELLTAVVLSGLYYFMKYLLLIRVRTGLILMAAALFVFDMGLYIPWAWTPEYSVQTVSRDIGSRIGQGTVAGSWAPALCLETKLKEFPFWENVVNDKNLTKTIPVTHLLLERTYFDLDFICRAYPDLLKNISPVATYVVNQRIIDLWELRHD